MTHDTGNLQDKIRFVTGSRRIRIRSSNGQIVLSGVARNALAGECAVADAQSASRSHVRCPNGGRVNGKFYCNVTKVTQERTQSSSAKPK
jgi:hypothetical protein